MKKFFVWACALGSFGLPLAAAEIQEAIMKMDYATLMFSVMTAASATVGALTLFGVVAHLIKKLEGEKGSLRKAIPLVIIWANLLMVSDFCYRGYNISTWYKPGAT